MAAPSRQPTPVWVGSGGSRDLRQFLGGLAKNVTCGFILSDLPQQGPELFGQHTALIDEFRSRINLGKEAAFNTVRIADVLQRQQLVKVHKLAALCARQVPCMAYSFTEQEHAGTGRWATKPVRSQSQSCPMILEKSADVHQFAARLFGIESSVESHRCHPEKCCARRQLKKPIPSYQKAILPDTL